MQSPLVHKRRCGVEIRLFNYSKISSFTTFRPETQGHWGQWMSLKGPSRKRIKPFQSVSAHGSPAERLRLRFQSVFLDGLQAVDCSANGALKVQQWFHLAHAVKKEFERSHCDRMRILQLRLPRCSDCTRPCTTLRWVRTHGNAWKKG